MWEDILKRSGTLTAAHFRHLRNAVHDAFMAHGDVFLRNPKGYKDEIVLQASVNYNAEMGLEGRLRLNATKRKYASKFPHVINRMVKQMRDVKKAPRIPRKKGQPANSKKHSDLYTDENPKGTIHGLKFATVKDAKRSVNKIKRSGKTHAHKIQAAVAMEQRAREMGKKSAAGIYRKYINSMKKKTKSRGPFTDRD